MKNVKKTLLLALCAILLVVASVAGTLAYLTDSDSVENTFTVGKVEITLTETKVDEYGVVLTGANAGTTETGNAYKLIPGRTYTKNPVITVGDESENCWLFVKIENGLGANAVITGLEKNGWTNITVTNYWAYAGAVVGKGAQVPVFDSFTYASTVADTAADADKVITVTAYAIQADGCVDSADAWAKLNGQLRLS